MIYHILASYEWEQAQATGAYEPISLDWEGFIHFSTLEQVIGTANRFYRGQSNLLLLEADDALLADKLRYESVTDVEAERFPHFYGPLPVATVVNAYEFPAESDGQFTLPRALVENRLPDIVMLILRNALKAVLPVPMIHNSFHLNEEKLSIEGKAFDLTEVPRIKVLALGKAAQGMARGVTDILGKRIDSGLVITKHLDPSITLGPDFEIVPGGHPLPTVDSLAAGEKALEFISGSEEKDLLLCLISGGGSSLMMLPEDGISLEDYQSVCRQLLISGATIHEFNTVRKHIDKLKGGKLVRRAAPAKLITCVLSDVIGNDLDVIASGPTYPDSTSFSDCLEILAKFELTKKTPDSVMSFLRSNAEMEANGNFQPDKLSSNDIFLLGDNKKAAEAARQMAERLGFSAKIITNSLAGEASIVGKSIAKSITEPVSYNPEIEIFGGETTVTIEKSAGTGGRNTETALGAVSALAGKRNLALVTFATDGEDGPTDAAGAIVTGESSAKALAKGLNVDHYLINHNAYSFFEQTGDLIKINPTGTNVNDLLLTIKY